MPTGQYHEPPDELPPETRTFARLCASLQEEAEAIGWYEQRLAIEPDSVAREIMEDAQGEEFKHFSMDLEFLLRRSPRWREIAEGVRTTSCASSPRSATRAGSSSTRRRATASRPGSPSASSPTSPAPRGGRTRPRTSAAPRPPAQAPSTRS